MIKIDPDWTEYFYDDLEANVHFLPASLNNVTDVAAYATDEANEYKMKRIVKRANDWCRNTITRRSLMRDTLRQLGTYSEALQSTNDQWRKKWNEIRPGIDLVFCEASS